MNAIGNTTPVSSKSIHKNNNNKKLFLCKLLLVDRKIYSWYIVLNIHNCVYFLCLFHMRSRLIVDVDLIMRVSFLKWKTSMYFSSGKADGQGLFVYEKNWFGICQLSNYFKWTQFSWVWTLWTQFFDKFLIIKNVVIKFPIKQKHSLFISTDINCLAIKILMSSNILHVGPCRPIHLGLKHHRLTLF